MAPSSVMLWKQPLGDPGQLKMLTIRLAGMSACAVAAVPPPRPVSATATVWVEPS